MNLSFWRSSVKLEPQCSANDKVNKSEVVIWLTTTLASWPNMHGGLEWMLSGEQRGISWNIGSCHRERQEKREALKQRQIKLCIVRSQLQKPWACFFSYASSSTPHPCQQVGKWAQFRTSVASRLASLLTKNWVTCWDSESMTCGS